MVVILQPFAHVCGLSLIHICFILLRHHRTICESQESILIIPELIEAPEGKVSEDEFTKEVVDENQTNLDQPVVVRSSDMT